jgi:hypothetical protein
MQLAPASLLDLAVDPHRACSQQLLGLSARVDKTSELEQLAETDHVTAYWDLAHKCSIAHRGRDPPPLLLVPVDRTPASWPSRRRMPSSI